MLDKLWGKKIKQLRIAAHLTQGDVNKKMNNPYNMMSQFEIGKKLMTEEQRRLFFEIVGKPIDKSIPVRAQEDSKPKAAVPPKASTRVPKAKPSVPARAEAVVNPESPVIKAKAVRPRSARAVKAPAATHSDVRTLAVSLIQSVLSSLSDEDLIELALNLKKGKSHA